MHMPCHPPDQMSAAAFFISVSTLGHAAHVICCCLWFSCNLNSWPRVPGVARAAGHTGWPGFGVPLLSASPRGLWGYSGPAGLQVNSICPFARCLRLLEVWRVPADELSCARDPVVASSWRSPASAHTHSSCSKAPLRALVLQQHCNHSDKVVAGSGTPQIPPGLQWSCRKLLLTSWYPYGAGCRCAPTFLGFSCYDVTLVGIRGAGFVCAVKGTLCLSFCALRCSPQAQRCDFKLRQQVMPCNSSLQSMCRADICESGLARSSQRGWKKTDRMELVQGWGAHRSLPCVRWWTCSTRLQAEASQLPCVMQHQTSPPSCPAHHTRTRGSECRAALCMSNMRSSPGHRHVVRCPELDEHAGMQDKCEPPVYVSDRRFMKAINLLQVAAHADGRSQV